ncbi:hypothetical protein BKA62DRAFT_680428 [Auriculariales sp. MPI-PUGE-AT-0066]|nr:hypothetical protein BKA62DRAFT_680428 [Auriculariales sp. MPI-PUGE-AT-0066]
MDKGTYHPVQIPAQEPAWARPARSRIPLSAALVTLALGFTFCAQSGILSHADRSSAPPVNAQAAILDICAKLDAPVTPAADFAERRAVSDRSVDGTPSFWIKNATLWTGDGLVHGGDILLANGLIKHVGTALKAQDMQSFGLNEAHITSFNALGGFITPAIVDAHSHAGVGSLPSLEGAEDTNSMLGIVQPWLRSLDGLNTHDAMFELSVAGGVGTALILPGSADAIGGQAFTIKLRPTAEKSPASMLVEPPFTYNGSGIIPSHPPKWRHLKQACGENPSRIFSGTRMDSIYAMRSIYTEARKLKENQDAFCASARAGDWAALADGVFPEDLRYEMLVDVLRGRVKVQTHCYEAVDLDNIARLSNEFKFPIAAFHHAHETYLVPDVLKKVYGGPPASAIFAAFARYKREAYRHSEYAPRILHDEGLPVIMKSDHPDPINMRDLLFEAQQAHYHGLPADVALASVMSTPAKLGATPAQVFIDGVAQLKKPVITYKSLAQQVAPKTPDFTEEAAAAVKYEGLPPLQPKRVTSVVRFINVRSISWPAPRRLSNDPVGEVIVRAGKVVCEGDCMSFRAEQDEDEVVVDLKDGEIAPGLTTFGNYGLSEILFESTTSDAPLGGVAGPFPSLLGQNPVLRAADGVSFGLRNDLLAYRNGVTSAVSIPVSSDTIEGIGSHISLGAAHKLESNAVPKPLAVLRMSIARGMPLSVSTQIGLLRKVLKGDVTGELGKAAQKVIKGEIPLVIGADSADIIATIIEIKAEVDPEAKIRIVISGAAEAHLLAAELAAAKIGVIVSPRPIPSTWDLRRHVLRPPLAEGSAVSTLLAHNVTTAVAKVDMWTWRARQTRFNLGWILAESNGALNHRDTIALGSTAMEKLLGLDINEQDRDMVAYAGGDIFSFESKPVAVIVPLGARVDLF